MKSQIKLGTLFGVELGLHYSWFVIALLIMFSLVAQFHMTNHNWSNAVVWAAAILTSVLFFAGLIAHEMSHAMVAKARGLPVHKITLFLLGGMAQIESEPADPFTEFWMGIAGPIASAVIGLALLGIAWAMGWVLWSPPHTPSIAILVWLGYINLALGAFNMIPGFPLDGGRVLRAILWWTTHNAVRSTRIAAQIGRLVGIGFIAYGLLAFFSGNGFGGIWLAFIGWFLLQAAGSSLVHLQASVVLRGVRVRDVMSRDCPSVPGDISLQQFVDEHLLSTGRRCYLVLDGQQMAGLITTHEVRAVERSQWPFVTVRQAMRPVDALHSLGPDASAMEALEMMSREDVNQLPVVLDGYLQGTVSRGHLLQVLQSRSEVLGTGGRNDPEDRRVA
jgi:Zn-dependent protease/predicted transcriptional regulator